MINEGKWVYGFYFFATCIRLDFRRVWLLKGIIGGNERHLNIIALSELIESIINMEQYEVYINNLFFRFPNEMPVWHALLLETGLRFTRRSVASGQEVIERAPASLTSRTRARFIGFSCAWLGSADGEDTNNIWHNKICLPKHEPTLHRFSAWSISSMILEESGINVAFFFCASLRRLEHCRVKQLTYRGIS